MVLPVTPLPARTVRDVDPISGEIYVYDWRDNRTKQRKPYTVNTRYDRRWGYVWHDRSWDGTPQLGSVPFTAENISGLYYDVNQLIALLNKVYDKLKSKVYSQASAGLNFVEARQSISMITRSAATIFGAYRDIRKLNFVGAAKKLKMHFVPPNVSKRKSVAANFLEYHFGWEPLIHDIYDALETYVDPVSTIYRETAKGHDSGFSTTETIFPSGSNGDFWKQSVTVWTEYKVRQGLTFGSVKNQTLFDLERWGVNNPASLVWEEVPFSFVVDWFVNVGQVLQSSGAYAGLDIKNPYYSFDFETKIVGTNGWVQNNARSPYGTMQFKGEGLYRHRDTSLWLPQFAVKSSLYPSATRAVTAVSLLTQQLKLSKEWVYDIRNRRSIHLR